MAKEVKLLEFNGHGFRTVREINVSRDGRNGINGKVTVCDHPEMEQILNAYLRAGYRVSQMTSAVDSKLLILLERDV